VHEAGLDTSPFSLDHFLELVRLLRAGFVHDGDTGALVEASY
jgi:hypothetical protein